MIEKSVLGGRVSIGGYGHIMGNFIQPDIRCMYGNCLQLCPYGKGNFWPITEQLLQNINIFLKSHATDFVHKLPWIVGFFLIVLPTDTSILPTVSPRLMRCDVTNPTTNKKRKLLGEIHSSANIPVCMNIIDAVGYSSNGYLVTLLSEPNGFYQDGGWYKPFENYLKTILCKSLEYEKSGDNNKRDAFKLMGNSIAGKCMERPSIDKCEIISEVELEDMFMEASIYPLYSVPIVSRYGVNKYVVKSKLPYYRARGPLQFGSSLLAHSRRMYGTFLKTFDFQRKNKIPLENRKHFLMYSDTDCAQIKIDEDISDEELSIMLTQHELSEYNDNTCEWIKVASKIEHVSVECITLGKKLRAIKCIDDEVIIKAKGQKVQLLCFDDFKDVWYDKQEFISSRISFQHNIQQSSDLCIKEINRQMNVCDYIGNVHSIIYNAQNFKPCCYMLKPVLSTSDAVVLKNSGPTNEIITISDERR